MIFSRGSKLHIIDGDTKYTYLISEASLTQNVREASYSRNTIHSTNLVDYSFADTKGPANISISMHLGRDETYIFEWMGLVPVYSDTNIVSYKIDPNYRQELSTAPTLYLESQGGTYKVPTAVLTTCSFSLGPKVVTSLSIGGQGSDLMLVDNVPVTPYTVTQNSSSFYTSSLSVLGFEHLNAVTLEYTRDVSWKGYKGIHEIGQVTTPYNPVVTRFALAGTITVYTSADNPTLIDSPDYRISITDTDFNYDLQSCMVSTRLNTTSAIHTTAIDFKLNPNDNSYINII